MTNHTIQRIIQAKKNRQLGTMTDEDRQIFQCEKSNYKRLMQRTPQEWMREIRKLPKRTRNRIACIVWWDQYGGQMLENPIAEFEEFLNDRSQLHEKICIKEMFTGLVAVGYSEYRAFQRVYNQGRFYKVEK